MIASNACSKIFLIALVAGFFMQDGSAMSMEHRISGKRAEDVFKSPHLAELAIAACDGNRIGVDRAINMGADPNGVSIDGGTPLLWAVYCNSPEGVDALLRNKADPNYRAQGRYSSVLAAATAANPNILRLILLHGGSANSDDGEGWTALRLALSYGVSTDSWENYYTLLHSGANINHRDGAGWTIAAYAASLKQYDKVIELLRMGCDQNPVFLGGIVQQGLLSAGSKQAVEREELKSLLVERGVHFPVPPLREIKPAVNP